MSKKNILSTFEKTGIISFNPEKVLAKVTLQLGDIPDLRPTSSKSNTSSLSDSDIDKIRVMFRAVISKNDKRMGRKLQNRVISLQTQLALVKAENKGLRMAVQIEKRRRKRGKPLFESLREESDGYAIIFSPSRLQHAKDVQRARELEKDKAAALKEAEKEAKRLAKKEQALLVVQRKGERSIARESREKARVKKQNRIIEEREARQADKQLQEEAKRARIQQREAQRLAKSSNSDERLVVVLKFKSNVTLARFVDVDLLVNEQPPQRSLRSKK